MDSHEIEQLAAQPEAQRPGIELTREETTLGRPSTVLRFRRFSILSGARQLLADGSPVPIGSRAFDLLVVLAEARGTVVTKEVIFRRVWPSTVVEESNLRFQMACLRKALGRDRDVIKTITGRGYLLAADVDENVPGEQRAARVETARHPVMANLVLERRVQEITPTLVLFGGDGPMQDRIQALLRPAGLQVQHFGSLNAG
jgi:DNA-binding winged helix-turn-helix (wHTH) protein